ncbi:hypothetical protein QAD02_004476 [Eretmocerus hayati]|uniref:Uncharacterized protein n=1 Tax=Eretmocerus hayati TaxID=131215 RepID=A0ACC2NQ50_9HYME|nr:hypothetical protein QAD02_004476 [Eretmocerus hayati]
MELLLPTTESGSININDVIAAIETADPTFEMMPGAAMHSRSSSQTNSVPYVEIIEQPASKALRFRYECEGRSAGSIPGANSTPENKTFPTIRIHNYRGRVLVLVSCVTKDLPYRPHPHNLVGKDVCNRGICKLEVPVETMTLSFDKLGIQCVKRKEIETNLRIRQEQQIDPFGTGYDHIRQPTTIDLNSVRLCFQAFIEGQEKGKFRVPLKPVVSDPIYDKKAMSDLMICKLSHYTASVAGGTEMVLLCEKVAKEDIQVRFFEERDGYVCWEGLGDFQPTQVHKQVAISFRTPSYATQQVEKPVQVHIQLRRPSDGATSDSLPFELLPLGQGRPSQLWSLRKTLARKRAALEMHSREPISCDGDVNDRRGFSDCIDELLNSRYAYSKLSNSRSQPSNSFGRTALSKSHLGIARDAYNNDTLDDDKTIVPERNGSFGDMNGGYDNKTTWSDYRTNQTEVGRWLQKTQESNTCIVEETSVDVAMEPETDDTDKSLKELLNEVVEIDEIYDEAHDKLVQQHQPLQINGNQVETDVSDNRSYTSLQMAMKNPVWDENAKNGNQIVDSALDVPPPRPPPPSTRFKQNILLESEGPLPPLPPKRIRKTPSMPVLPQGKPPNKNLPTPPNVETLKQTKSGIFSKLFSKNKSKKNVKDENKRSSTASLPGLTKESLLSADLIPVRTMAARDFDLDGNETPPYGAELTEAETYALYTAMAPHATASEFDEMSFYYSPVEAGKILTDTREVAQSSQ